MEQDGVSMKHLAETGQKRRVTQGGLSSGKAGQLRNAKTYRVSRVMSLKLSRRQQLPLLGMRRLARILDKARRQGQRERFLYDKATKEERCIDCDVSPVRFLCEDCKRKREVDAQFDRDYAAWQEQQQPGETFGRWLLRR
jgi:hypothetical protein